MILIWNYTDITQQDNVKKVPILKTKSICFYLHFNKKCKVKNDLHTPLKETEKSIGVTAIKHFLLFSLDFLHVSSGCLIVYLGR